MNDSFDVLAVDDDPALADLVAEMLPRANERFDVETAAGAQAGLDLLDTREFDCIVSDYDMPGMDGIDFLRAVRRENADLPFILFTGKGSEEVAGDAISAGVTDYLQKQVGTEQYTLLANKVEHAIERVRAERAREHHLKAIETANEGISILDDSGEFVYVNETYADIYGYDPDEMLGEHWELLYPDDEVAATGEHVFPTVERDGHWQGETIGLRADGTTFVEGHSIAATDSGGLVCTVTDLSERKQRETELQQLEARLERFASAVPNGLFLVSPDYEETRFVNDAAEELYGVPKADLSADPSEWLRNVHPDDIDRLTESVNRQHTGDVEWPVEQEFRIEHPERGQRWLLTRIQPVVDGDGTVTELAGVATDITAQKEQARQLTELNTVLETIVENLPMGVLVEDADRDVLMANDSLGETLGVPLDSDDLIGRDCAKAAEGIKGLFAEPEAFITDIDDRIDQRDPVRGEQLRLADDRVLERDYVPYTLPDGDTNLWLYRDVTERRRQARELETRLAAMDAAMDGISLLDADDEYVYMNQAHADIFGYDPEELVGSTWRRVYGDEAIERIEAEVFPELERTGEWRGETVGKRRDGSQVHQEITLTRLDDGKLICTNRDITAQKAREREARNHRTHLRQIIDLVPDPVFVKDREGRYFLANEATAEAYGMTPDDVEGKTEREVIPNASDSETFRQDDLEVIESGERKEIPEETLTTVDGETRVLQTTKIPYRHSGTDERAVLGYARDVTELKRKEEQLRRERDRLEEFASFVSHDLRNPLNVAMARTELAREECNSDSLPVVERSLERMERLITELLALARQGDRVGSPESVPLGPLVTQCWSNVDTAEATIELETDQIVSADRNRTTALLENLFRNAVEHGGSDVTVTVGPVAEGTGFYVADDGVGLPEAGDAVFESGFTTDDSGTGFGLAIVSEIAAAHEWEVDAIESDSGGARFEITGVETVEQKPVGGEDSSA